MEEPTVVDAKLHAAEPTLFGARYRPIALLGSGGMGSVYLTRDLQLDELVAVKVLRADLGGSMLERFRDEVRLARRVTSPFVARTHDLAEHEGRFFVTMEYVEGETLSALLRRKGRLSVDEVVRIARDVCDGLAAVHAAGVVHRDLKPANVMVTRAGRAMLTDFGIALRAETARGATDGSGTPTYTAPEQLAGGAVDARADIYALGATLYALVTGQRPFSGARTGLETPPDPRRACPDVPEAFAAIAMRAMELAPGDRFQSCAALRAALDALRPSRTSTRPPALRGWVRSLGARAGRRVTMKLEARGVALSLGEAARADLVARLNARGQLRVVQDEADAEASLDARLVGVGDRCLLALRLQSLGDGYVFWSDAIESPLQALPQMLERASNAVERAFVPSSTPSPASTPFESAEAASLVLEGRAEYRGFWGTHLQRSIELFEKARALAPEHPLILAWCAAAHARHRFFEETTDDPDVARDLAERAVTLAPEIPEVHIALAIAHMQDLRAVEAVRHYVNALRIAPGLLEQRVAFARLLSECGAVEPSLALTRGAIEADPTYFEPIELHVRHHALRGRIDLAAREAERAIGAKDAFACVGLARYTTWYRDQARFDAARSRLDPATLDAQPHLILKIWTHLFAGEVPSLEPLEARTRSGPTRRRVFFHQILAEVHAFRADEERTLGALEAATDLGFIDVQWLDMCPLLEPLRGTLRFESLHATVRARAIAVLAEVERCLEP